MTKSQLIDNLMFACAMEKLGRLFSQGALSEQEFNAAKKDLERRLRPTIIAFC